MQVVTVGGAAVDLGHRLTTASCRQLFHHDAGETMKYLCLVYQDEKQLEALPDSEYDVLMSDTLAYDDDLRQSGYYIASDALEFVRTVATVRVRNGRVSVTDSPFAEMREQLGGYILIEARDLNAAIRVVSKMPPARLGFIEVRPIKEFAPWQPRRNRPCPFDENTPHCITMTLTYGRPKENE